ncbi:MAG TPA: cation transporter [Anaerolineae bacterium]|nr:cation transporter [Anaerolineae bacterium]
MHNHNQHNDHHNHSHPHDHKRHNGDHHHHGAKGLRGWIKATFHLHGHSHQHGALANDQAFVDNSKGICTVWLALIALTVTSVIQILIVLWSGSVALLADTLHNVGDGLNSIPLLIAFYLARRVATRRYTYGFGRAEDVAGIFIVLSIAISAGVIFWESFQKFLDPQPITHLNWVAAAAVIGFLGNEAVALLQIRVGREIGSAALVADGLHARTDGLTSLAVLLAVGGTWLGFPILDPIIGILIGIAILFITKDATVTMWYRLMDAIEPEILHKAEAVVHAQPNIQNVNRLRMRWMGHRLHAEVCIAVDPQLTMVESHQIAEELRHNLFHKINNLAEVMVHIDPWSEEPERFHQLTTHHEPIPEPIPPLPRSPA